MLAKDAMDYIKKLPPDEPVFVLRAQDCLASEIVEKWALRASAMNVNNDKVTGAFACAEEMLQWPIRKVPD